MDKQKLFKYINDRKGFVTLLILFVIPFLKVFMHHFLFPSNRNYDFSRHFSLLFEDKLFLFIPSIIIVILVLWNFSSQIDKLLYYFKTYSFEKSNLDKGLNKEYFTNEVRFSDVKKKIFNARPPKEFSNLLTTIFDSKHFINFRNFIISWFSLTIVKAIVFPIIRGSRYMDGSINSNVITGILTQTFASFLLFYFTIKLLVFIFSKKHEWPTGWGYHILPWIYMFLEQFLNSEYYRDYLYNLRILIENG